jgi:hypothetical protein
VAVPLPISIYYFAFVYIFAYPHRGLWLRGCTARVVVLHLCADRDEREFSGCNFLSTIRGYDKQSIVCGCAFDRQQLAHPVEIWLDTPTYRTVYCNWDRLNRFTYWFVNWKPGLVVTAPVFPVTV